MESSLRYGGETKSKTLKLHAKQRFPLDSNNLLQAHAELDTYVGAPSYLALMFRHFYPQAVANVGVGVHSGRSKTLNFNLRAKKEFLLNESGHLRFNVKGRMNLDKDFKVRKAKAAGEFCLYKLDFQKDQVVRLNVGYEVCEKVPYFEIRENNWTFNYDMNGNWNVKYYLSYDGHLCHQDVTSCCPL